ncbi:MAG: MmgE/PrpD family protein [Chloroflexi bacterium]|nr:MmgE/PrpD family protein [Chloroflexota bacterium]
MGLSAIFARNILSLKYEDVPPEVVTVVKKVLLDSVAVGIAGSSAPGARDVLGLMIQNGGVAESTAMVSGHRLPAASAAMANGAMIRALDYNDTYDDGRTHPGVPVTSAAFAVAEKVGEVNGKDFIAAATAAMDLHCRLARAVLSSSPPPWLFPQLHGYIPAAAVAGRLLGLDEDRLLSAFGLAYAQTAGSRQVTTERTLARGMQGAFSSAGGVMAAQLAQRGVTGPRESLEGEFGLFNAYHQGMYNRDELVAGLGAEYPWANLSFKPYPSHKQTHVFIDAALQLKEQYQIRPEDVEKVVVSVGNWSKTLCEPLDICQQPRNLTEGQFAIPFTVAVALVNGNVRLNDFLGDGLTDPSVIRMARKVVPETDPDLNRVGIESGVVTVTVRGERHTKRVDHPRGDPKNPFTLEDHIAKFRDCVTWAAKPLRQTNVDRAIEQLLNLEKVNDAGSIMRLVGGE